MWRNQIKTGFYRKPSSNRIVDLLLSSFAKNVAELDLGSKTKLNQRSFNILLDLIKCKSLVLLKFSDSVFEEFELDQIKKILLNEIEELNLRGRTNVGVEGCALLRHLFVRCRVKRVNFRDGGMLGSKLLNVFQGLIEMKGNEIEEINLYGNSVGQQGLSLLKKLMTTKRIIKLNLSFCYINSEQLEYVLGGLQKMDNFMERLYLKGNLLTKIEKDKFVMKTKNKVIEIEFH